VTFEFKDLMIQNLRIMVKPPECEREPRPTYHSPGCPGCTRASGLSACRPVSQPGPGCVGAVLEYDRDLGMLVLDLREAMEPKDKPSRGPGT